MCAKDVLPDAANGGCRYCNRCMPCPAGIAIGKANKLLDRYLAGDKAAKAQYHAMKRNASNCFQCGACELRCPFGVKNRDRMRMAREVMQEPSGKR